MQDHLEDNITSKQISETIEKHGEIEAVLKEAKTKGIGLCAYKM